MMARYTNPKIRPKPTIRVFVLALSVLATAGSLAAVNHGHAKVSTGSASHQMLQYQAGSHVLGFESGEWYMAALDHALRVEFVGAGDAAPQSSDNPGRQAGPIGTPPFKKVIYRKLWNGIDIQYDSADNGIAKSTYLLEPRADVTRIRLRYNVAVALQDDGSLRYRLSTQRGMLTESAPIAWQEILGRRVSVPVAFELMPDNTVGFRLGAYDPQRALVIDPTYHWHTFYGSSSFDRGAAIAVDASRNIYVTGSSDSSWLGDSNTLPLWPNAGGGDIVIVKLNSSGFYLWHAFFGSPLQDSGAAIAVDGAGNVVVVGSSSISWEYNIITNPLHAHSGGSNDIVVIKLDTHGAYQWHTFYGSSDADEAYAVALDGSGNICLSGDSYASWYGDGSASPLHSHSGLADIVVVKLNGNGAYQWHTFYGSNSADAGRGIAVDTGNNILVAGYSLASWLGNGGAIPQHSFGGSFDMTVLKLNGNGAYLWHTFYGSSTADIAWGIDVDNAGNIYVSGYATQTWLGTGDTSPIHAYSGTNEDVAVLKLNGNGVYQWHTFYGSTGQDSGKGIAVDGSGSVYIAGSSDSSWQGDGSTDPLHAHSGQKDILLLRLNTSGAYQSHTFYGSASNDIANGIAIDDQSSVSLAGESDASWLGDSLRSPRHAHSGGGDIVVIKLSALFFNYLPLIVK
jgi:hypothetical protein